MRGEPEVGLSFQCGMSLKELRMMFDAAGECDSEWRIWTGSQWLRWRSF